MDHDLIEARFARLEQKLAAVDAQLALTRRTVAWLEARAAVADAGITHLSGRLADVTADDNGEWPGVVEYAAGRLPWTMDDDGTTWRAQLPDGRTAVITRLVDGDDDGNGAAFLPCVHESARDFASGPVCAGLLGAAAWVWDFAGLGR